jgi:hypothetical protein
LNFWLIRPSISRFGIFINIFQVCCFIKKPARQLNPAGFN